MARGFTLLEFAITLMVMVVLLLVAVPSYQSVMDTIKMQRLASELNGFLIQAKSEAVTRNKKMYVHFSFSDSSPVTDGNWYMELTDSSSSGGQVILYLDGKGFNGVSIEHSYSTQYITFEQVRGRPNGGTIQFYPKGAVSNSLSATISNPPGRVKICGVNGETYDYAKC